MTGRLPHGCWHQPEHALSETEEVSSGLEYVRNSDTSCPIHNAFMYTSFLLLSIWFISNVLSVYCFRHGTCLYSGRMSGELNCGT